MSTLPNNSGSKSPLEAELDRVQRWMQTVITHPDGVERGVASPDAQSEIPVDVNELERVIRPSSRLDSCGRLRVYANAYYARLIECLESEFPAVRRAVGDETFTAFAFGYLQKYPSRSYTLAQLGAQFPAYLEEIRPPRDAGLGEGPDWADFIVDLARLERIYSEVFDGPGTEKQPVLTADDLAQLSPDVWPEARIVTAPCLRLVQLRFPAEEYISAVRRGEEDIPAPAAEPTWLVVTRRDYIVRRWQLSRAQFELLSHLQRGATVRQAIAAAVAAVERSLAVLEQQVRDWFRQWTAARLFVRIEVEQ